MTTKAHCQRQQELGITPPQIVQAEANLLQFPFFALHTKGLKNRKGIEVTGVKTIDDREHEFVYRVTRNTDSMYPGPLARETHFGLLALLFDPSKHTYPFRNPISFTWRELSAAAGLVWSGDRTIERFKDAICCTHGVVIKTNYALVAKSQSGDRTVLPKRERGYHLYEQYEFCNELGVDGDVVKANRIWLADWYLSNLNSLYSGPVNYEVWYQLNEVSPIASRIYELLQFKCYKSNVLRINYKKFCSLLPITPHSYASLAHQQLDEVFDLLLRFEIVTSAAWSTSRDGQMQLTITGGAQLRRRSTKARQGSIERTDSELIDRVSVREITNDETMESAIVKQFHTLWSGNSNRSPSKSELDFASQLIESNGSDVIEQLLPKLVKLMKKEFPNAKTFGAAKDYFPTLITNYHRRRRSTPLALPGDHEDDREGESKKERLKRKQVLLNLWKTCSDEEKRTFKLRAVAFEPSQSIKTILERATSILHRFRYLINLPLSEASHM